MSGHLSDSPLADGAVPAGGTSFAAGEILPAAVTAVVVAASGVLVGLAWCLLAPRVGLIKMADGQLVYADPTPEQAVAADGWFGLLGLGTGVLAGLLAWVVLRRWRGPAILVGLAIGGLAAAILASWLGHELAYRAFLEARDAAGIGQRLDGPLLLRARGLVGSELGERWRPTLVGVIPVQALAAVFVYTCLAGFSAHSTLRGHREVSSDWAERGAPTAPPAPPEPGEAA